MAAPVITWYKHTSASDTTGTQITTLDFGTVNAGSWSTAQCIRAHLSASSTTTVSSVRFWMYDQSAKLTGTNVTLRDGSKAWSFVGTHQAALSSKNFVLCSSGYGSPVPYYPNTSVGAGFTLPNVTTPGDTHYIWIGVKPNASAASGAYTGWGFQLAYDY